ncbi:MAG TPA: hypothetical protein VK599_01885 [Streptosporangiaceae bacterium]|nr:hypothetical protein [Streptosporangiaceae bacterium]
MSGGSEQGGAIAAGDYAASIRRQMGRPAGELDPEWVMAGVDVPAGKRLYASRDLKGSAFAVAASEHSYSADGWHLTTTMQRMLVITKPTYAECLAELMTIWQNWDAEGKQLPAAPARNGLPARRA